MNDAGIAMDRLHFQLPEFVRLGWVGEPAKEVWGPRLDRIRTACEQIEWLSVVSGIRSCGVTTATPEGFIAHGGEWAKHGLNALPLEIQGLTNYAHANKPVKTELGRPFIFRFVLGRPQDAADFRDVWERCDERGIGRLLGYPQCCQDFFHQIWHDQGLVDTTWQMAARTVGSPNGDREVEVTGPPEANILWRWMGVRAVPHLPCRFDCPHTVELGRKLVNLAQEAGYKDEMDWMLDMLSWPVEWSALHGIAEIKTPILRVSTCTDATPTKYVVRRRGETYPPEGARGVDFPYRAGQVPLDTHRERFRRGSENPIRDPDTSPEWYASNNGFDSTFAMDQSCEPIVELAAAILAGRPGNVLDLGCGNGALLKRIHEASPGSVPFGIDVNAERLEHARRLLPQFADNFTLGRTLESDLIWPEGRRYDLVILSPRILLEVEAQQGEKLKERIRGRCDNLLIYVYDGTVDSLARYNNLEWRARKAGMRLTGSGRHATASLARIES